MNTLNFLPLLFFISITSLAQDIIENIDGVGKIQKNSKKEISYFQSIGKEKVFTDHSDFYRNVLNISKNDEFRLLNEGKSFNKYHQYFNGVPVKNGVFALHINNGIIKSANGNYVRIGELNTNPAISKVRAMERWCNYLNVPIKDVSHFKSELFVIDLNEYNESASHSRPVLAYRTRVYSKSTHLIH